MAFALSSSSASTAFQSLTSLHSGDGLHLRPSNLLLPRHSLATSTLAFSRRRNHNSTVTSSSKKKKKSVSKKEAREEDEIDEDAFEALFGMLEDDLKSDDLSMGDGEDEDGDLSEKDLEKLQRELEEALGVGGDDDVEVEMASSVGDDVEDDDGDEEEGEGEERPVMLKNWQFRRLARVLKIGRRKTGIKSLAAELCLDRAVVLDLLRDPPPNLVMMSAALPDEPAPTLVMPETKPSEIVPEETGEENVVKSEREMKLPVHVRQDSWFARKRLKKVHVETLERVYRRTKRPTNTMVSSIVHVTNLPRKRVVKWFEDKRAEDGVPEHRNPFQSSEREFSSMLRFRKVKRLLTNLSSGRQSL